MSGPTRPCANPLCSYVLLGGALYCCGACANAHEGRYEIHESGPLGHSILCACRLAEPVDTGQETRLPPGRRDLTSDEVVRLQRERGR